MELNTPVPLALLDAEIVLRLGVAAWSSGSTANGAVMPPECARTGWFAWPPPGWRFR